MKCEKFIELAKAHGIDPLNIWDIGSFDAAQAVELAVAFPKAKVLALEADLFNIAKCVATLIGAEPVSGRVSLINAALVSIGNPALVNFNRSVGPNDQVGSLLRPSDPDDYPTRPILVPAVTATELSDAFGYPDLLWMDVQGTETDFFDCQTVRPELVWLEFAMRRYYEGQPLEKDVEAFMASMGYSVVHRHVEAEGWFGDFCLLRKEAHCAF